jgi:hypothetical protein
MVKRPQGVGLDSNLGARLSEGPALTSAIYLACAQSHRAVEAHSNTDRNQSRMEYGRLRRPRDDDERVPGFTRHYRNWAHRICPLAHLRPLDPAQPYTERALDALDYADGSARLSEA